MYRFRFLPDGTGSPEPPPRPRGWIAGQRDHQESQASPRVKRCSWVAMARGP